MVKLNFNDSRPMLFQFDNGSLSDEKKSFINIKYLRTKASKSDKRKLVVDTGNLTYAGAVIQKQSSYMKYYIGVVDKHTKKIEQVESCLHCTLKPKVNSEETQSDSKLANKSLREKTDTLVESFGSSRQKRLVSARKRNEEVNNTISDKVSNIVNTIIDKSPPAFLAEKKNMPETPKEEFISPPLNRYALQVQDMYHVDDIITYQIFQKVRPHAQDIIDSDSEQIKQITSEANFSEYVCHHLQNLPSSSSEREKRATFLCYLEYMIKFYMIHPRSIDKKDCCPEVPVDVQHFLFDQFVQRTDEGKKFLPKKYKDKLLYYILVFCLILENHEMSCNLIMKDLKLGVGKLSNILKSIGCMVKNPRKRRVDENNDPIALSVTAILQLPKTVPTPVKLNLSKDPPNSEKKKASSKTPAKKPASKTPAKKSTSETPAKKIKLEPAA